MDGEHATWVVLGVKNLIFPNMVMWHIKLKGMVNRTGYKSNFQTRVKLGPLRGVKTSNIIKFNYIINFKIVLPNFV